jgi:hypothetical protein
VTLLIALHLIFLHGADHQQVIINVAEISSIRESQRGNKQFDDDVACVLYMTNSKIIGVTETCNEVVDRIKAAE